MAETKTTTKATTTTKEKEPLNVCQKLLKVRAEILKSNIEKSGKNNAMAFMYFELKDIVPVATPLFEKYGLLTVTHFTEDTVTLEVVNVDKPDEIIVFTSPFRILEGNRGMNPVQALGGSHTYMRRYMYLLALDLVENDTIDAEAPLPQPKGEKPKKVIPATTEERKEIAKELTDTESKADDLQIKSIAGLLKKLKELDPSKEEWIQELVIKTDKFQKLTHEKAEKLIDNLNQMISNYGG